MKKIKILNKKSGFSIIELVAAITLSLLIITIISPSLNQYIILFKHIQQKSVSTDVTRVVEIISDYVGSATIETENMKELDGIKNRGLAILDTKGIFLSNTNKYVSTILSAEDSGDGVYIEIPSICTESGVLKFSNEAHIFRFVTKSSFTGIQELRYIQSEIGKSNGRDGIISFRKEEVLLSNLKDGKFYEIDGGVILEFKTSRGNLIREVFLRNGEV